MHDTLSTDCGSSGPSSTFPYWPRPKSQKAPPNLQRESHICELADPLAWLHSLRAFPRVVVVVAPFMCLISASALFESGACAQTASRPPSIDRFANFVTKRPLALPYQGSGSVPSSKLKAQVTRVRFRLAA